MEVPNRHTATKQGIVPFYVERPGEKKEIYDLKWVYKNTCPLYLIEENSQGRSLAVPIDYEQEKNEVLLTSHNRVYKWAVLGKITVQRFTSSHLKGSRAAKRDGPASPSTWTTEIWPRFARKTSIYRFGIVRGRRRGVGEGGMEDKGRARKEYEQNRKDEWKDI